MLQVQSVSVEGETFLKRLFFCHTRQYDNEVSREERQVLYFLEEKGVVRQGRLMTTLHDGRAYMVFYWELMPYTVMEDIEAKKEENIYENEELWSSIGR